MPECIHNHLIRDENMPPLYSCEACGNLFEVEPISDDYGPKPVMGVPHGS